MLPNVLGGVGAIHDGEPILSSRRNREANACRDGPIGSGQDAIARRAICQQTKGVTRGSAIIGIDCYGKVVASDALTIQNGD